MKHALVPIPATATVLTGGLVLTAVLVALAGRWLLGLRTKL